MITSLFLASLITGGRLCALIGVPWRGGQFQHPQHGATFLGQYVRKGAEIAEHAETPGHTYALYFMYYLYLYTLYISYTMFILYLLLLRYLPAGGRRHRSCNNNNNNNRT